ncbi:MAG: hypothetical protein H6510_08755 [Acidobacteria bacterium]|nr:hypothetical protein [Acidobacteriota bacterium]MCB9397892.1 hypothetical protein [Acidobacteriota bacterium]
MQDRLVLFGPNNLASCANDLVWNPALGLTSSTLFDATYDGSRYLVVGSNRKIFSSNDGVMWDEEVLPTENLFTGVYADSDRLLVIGQQATVLYRYSLNAEWALWPQQNMLYLAEKTSCP